MKSINPGRPILDLWPNRPNNRWCIRSIRLRRYQMIKTRGRIREEPREPYLRCCLVRLRRACHTWVSRLANRRRYRKFYHGRIGQAFLVGLGIDSEVRVVSMGLSLTDFLGRNG